MTESTACGVWEFLFRRKEATGTSSIAMVGFTGLLVGHFWAGFSSQMTSKNLQKASPKRSKNDHDEQQFPPVRAPFQHILTHTIWHTRSLIKATTALNIAHTHLRALYWRKFARFHTFHTRLNNFECFDSKFKGVTVSSAQPFDTACSVWYP